MSDMGFHDHATLRVKLKDNEANKKTRSGAAKFDMSTTNIYTVTSISAIDGGT